MFGLEEMLLSLLQQFGYAMLFLIVFAESGLFIGFFLPGDSLLFTAGLLASQGYFDIAIVLFGTALAAILGDQVGYWSGKKFGHRFFNKPGSFFRDPKHVREAEEFYQKHGKISIVLARFVPAVRTFAPIVAGIGKMDYADFVKYNILGGILWTFVFVGLGYFLGSTIPNAESLLLPIVAGIIVLSIVPIGWKMWKKKQK